MSEIAKEGLTIVSKDNGLTLVSIVTDALQVSTELSKCSELLISAGFLEVFFSHQK